MNRLITSFFLLLSVFLLSKNANAQCHITVTLPTQDTTICQGDSVYLKSDGTCSYLMNNDFNGQIIGPGWSSTQANPVFNNPCGPGPVGYHLWVGTTASTSRTLVTQSYDLQMNGCVVEWWMRYGPAGSSAGSCESPDMPTEGVHVQYSTNNGATWTDFPGPNLNPVGINSTTGPFVNPMVTTTPGSGGYWTPSPGNSATGPLYYWHKFENVVPVAAQSTNTKIRWAQLATSNQNFDAWGIDEVQISCPNNQNVIWSHGAVGLVPPAPVSPTTTTSYIVVIFDSLLNVASDTVQITVIPNPQPDLGPDTTICNQPGNMATFDAGSGYQTYLWSTGATTQTISTNISGTYSVTVSTGNCTGTDDVTLDFQPAPTPNAGPDVEICIGESATLTGVPIPNGYQAWSTGDSTVSTTVSPLKDSTFYYTVFSSPVCFATDSAMVIVHPLPLVDAGVDTAVCKGDSVMLIASNAASYQWSNGKNSPFNTVAPNVLTSYRVTGTDVHGCVNSDTVVVDVNPLPELEIVVNKTEYCFGDTIMVDITGADFYQWTNGQTSNHLEYMAQASHELYVTGTDIHGCHSSDRVSIPVEDCVKFFIGSAFTPNGDGLNDIFIPFGNLGGVTSYDFIIYNRWGQVVFQTDNPYKGWDGYFEGNRMTGVFTYIINFTTMAGNISQKTGTVTIIH